MRNADDSNNDERLARAAAATRKETEDLLAGFDRPGRTPRAPPVKRDFVDYHLEKGRSNPDLKPSTAERARRDLPTAIIPEPRRRFPAWLPWGVLLLVMAIGGALVSASVLLSPSTTTAPTTRPSTGTTAPRVEATTGAERDIPPPGPPGPTSAAIETAPIVESAMPAPTAPTPSASTQQAHPRPSTPNSPSAPPSATVTPSSDFIRHL